jgi:hypothetical protein
MVLDQFSKTEYKDKPRHMHRTRFRFNDGYVVPKFNNKYGKRTLEYNVPKILNMMPASIKKCKSKNIAKKLVKEWLIKCGFVYN